MSRERFARRDAVEVPCTVDVQASEASLHAHVELEGVEIGPGDTVLVHDAPYRVAPGERVRRRCQATVTRAGRLGRAWTRASSLLALAELVEVGFTPRRNR